MFRDFNPICEKKYSDHDQKNVIIMKFSSILTKNSENCYYFKTKILRAYFKCIELEVLSYRLFSFRL